MGRDKWYDFGRTWRSNCARERGRIVVWIAANLSARIGSPPCMEARDAAEPARGARGHARAARQRGLLKAPEEDTIDVPRKI